MGGAPLPKTETGLRVLALLAALPDQELHTNELIRRTSSNPNAVQRAVVQLERTGILRSRRLGNLRLWRMDRDHPLYATVRDLVMRTSGLPARLQTLLARDRDIKYAFLFGSFVSAQDDAASDIDLFVVGPADWARLSRAVRAVGAEVGRELRPVVWSRDDLKNPNPAQRQFLENVLSAPVIWLTGDRDEFERDRSLASAVAGRRGQGQRQSSRRTKPRQSRAHQRRARTKGTRG